MNPNADYLGIVTLLRGLREQGLVSGSEAKKIAARLMVQLGADIIIRRCVIPSLSTARPHSWSACPLRSRLTSV